MRDGETPNNLLQHRGEVLDRERELGALDEALRQDRRVAVLPATPAPLGGMGSTALAVGYARRALTAGAYPGGVFFVHAAGHPADALARLALDLRVFGGVSLREALDLEPLDAPSEDAARAVRRALQAEREPTLLVLDDVDEPGFPELLPLGEVRVLMIPRDPRLAFRRKVLVPPLVGTAAADRARQVGARPRDGADRLALEALAGKELAGWPLAVDLAARHVLYASRSWTAYAAQVRARAKHAGPLRDPLADYPPGVIAAVDVAVGRFPSTSTPRRLLEGAGVFAPHGLPAAWALAAADLPPGDLDAALAPLVDLGLVRFDPIGETLSMHRLVHRRVRDLVPMETWLRASRRAAASVAVWLAEGQAAARAGDVLLRRAHVDAALAAADRSGADLSWVIIADRLGVILERRAAHHEARDLLERALHRAERLEPPDPGQVRVCLSNLAGLLVEMGRAREARPLLERALAIDDEPGQETPIPVRLSKLSRVLNDLGHGEAARPLLERALTVESDEPPLPSAARLPESARVLQEMRQAPGGDDLIDRALAGDSGGAPDVTKLLRTVEQAAAAPATSEGGPTAAELTSLGLSLYALGHPGDARPLLERALVSDEAVHGPDHPEVAADLMNLAAVLRSLGEKPRARACLERAMAIAQATLPEDDALRTGIAARLARV